MKLGEQLRAARVDLEDLLEELPAGPDKTRLRGQLQELLDKTARLSSQTMDERTEGYRAAVQEIDAACQALREAQVDLDDIEDAAEKVARGLDAVSRLLRAPA